MTSRGKRDAPLTRARAQGAVRAEGVLEIVAIMASGEWRGARSTLDLAKARGVSPETVRDWAGEASRTLRTMAAHDVDDLRAIFVARFERLERLALEKQAMTKEGVPYDAPDVRSAIAAVAEQAELLGLGVTREQELTATYLTALYAEFHAKLSPEVYAQVVEVARGLRLEQGKRLPRAVRVTVEDA
jgi:hypothetical protein